MRNYLRYLFLLSLRALTRVFYRHEVFWQHPEPPGPWRDLRLIAILNHTSLFEWLMVGAARRHLVRSVASNGLVPIADTTLKRPFVGRFLNVLAPEFVSITREPDHTWKAVLSRVGPKSLVVILPEGRMKRSDGLDKNGQPMTVRGGIADILRALPGGRMLLVYSGGLHHIQVPGQTLPKLWKTIRVGFELVDIAEYKRELGADKGSIPFKNRVKADLQARRDQHCPVGREVWDD